MFLPGAAEITKLLNNLKKTIRESSGLRPANRYVYICICILRLLGLLGFLRGYRCIYIYIFIDIFTPYVSHLSVIYTIS